MVSYGSINLYRSGIIYPVIKICGNMENCYDRLWLF